jgi:TPR repeat protein
MAKGFHQLSRAARRDCVDAQYRVGRCYLEGRVVPRSRIEALRWLERAAEREHAEAQFLVAALYAQGVGCPTDPSSSVVGLFAPDEGTEPNYEAALKWARRQDWALPSICSE